jgi:asparagine synthase (glutamine-hydrolysing)
MHVEPGVGLGHKRLSIIDSQTGQQPLYNEDRSVCIVYNGEIYNYQELMPELSARPHVPHEERHRGRRPRVGRVGRALRRALPRHFRLRAVGQNRESLFLARDRLGVKPLHYAILADGTVLFGFRS